MTEPAQKCDKQCYFKQKYNIKLFIAFKMACSCCFG